MSTTPPEKNPYEPPKESLAEVMAESHHHHRFRWTAALAGFAVDIGATVLGGCVIGLVAGLVLAMQGSPVEDVERQISGSTAIQVGSLVYGLCCTALGGYVAAWIAGFKPVLHAVAAGAISLIWGLLVVALNLFVGFYFQPLWITIAGMILVLPAAAVGGVLRGSR